MQVLPRRRLYERAGGYDRGDAGAISAIYRFTPRPPSAIKECNSPTQTLSHDEYLGAMLGHRFCLIAAGDYTSTHKITEGTLETKVDEVSMHVRIGTRPR